MVYATSDLHGYPLEKFIGLLRRAGFGDNDFLFILGDVVDRNGDGGIAMLQWIMMQPNVELLLGNHESMLLSCAFLFDEITDDSLDRLTPEKLNTLAAWLANGAEPTLASLRKLNRQNSEAVSDILDFLRDAPMYDAVSLDSGDFILTHAGLGNFHPDKALSEYTERELLWHRPRRDERYFDDAFTVFGHTPTVFYEDIRPMRACRTDTWIDIDVGAASGEPPMILRLDDMQAFYA